MKKKLLIDHNNIISVDNLLCAWKEFLPGKKSKKDVIEFSMHLMDNILQLHDDLANKTYHHGGYRDFYITDPKLRHIHKASVRDRLLHHAVYRQLYPFFAKTFIADSYSCQTGKGTHKAVEKFKKMTYKVSKNNTKTCWVLKCDIKRFFDSIDHIILINILEKYISDHNIINLLKGIVNSFEVSPSKGLPLGNLTSQLFVNIYMNEFDQFVKHKLKAKHYIRYADDFLVINRDKAHLVFMVKEVQNFLQQRLELVMRPEKIFIQTINSGVDFLGWINFFDHRILRTKTKRRMTKKIKKPINDQSLQSYLGFLKHGDTFYLRKRLLNNKWLLGEE